MAKLLAYAVNRAWVFQPGRHGRLKEIVLFYSVSAIDHLAGTLLGSLIVARYAIGEYFVSILALAMSALVNFLGRKYSVFLSCCSRPLCIIPGNPSY